MSEREKVVEARIRVAMHREGVWCQKNRIEACWQCGAKPKKTDGLGVGSSDLICIVPPLGLFLPIEVKSAMGVVSDEQERWLAAVRLFGAKGGVARSEEDALRLLAEVRR